MKTITYGKNIKCLEGIRLNSCYGDSNKYTTKRNEKDDMMSISWYGNDNRLKKKLHDC